MTNSKQQIFVFAGQMGSGKDTCACYLAEKYGAQIFSFTNMLKDITDRFYLEFNRDNLIGISNAIRSTFGEDIMAKTMAKDVDKSQANMIAIGNARRLADIEYLSKLDGFVLTEISADIHTRYERTKIRGEKASDANQTYEKFVADHQQSTELSIIEVAKQATVHIDNNGTKDELYAQLDRLVKKHS